MQCHHDKLFWCYVTVLQSDTLAVAKQEELKPKIRDLKGFCLFLTRAGESKTKLFKTYHISL